MEHDPNNQTSCVSWLSVNPNALELALLNKANITF